MRRIRQPISACWQAGASVTWIGHQPRHSPQRFCLARNHLAQHLFDERIGPVCRPDKAALIFNSARIDAAAIPLHTRTRPSAWTTWAEITGEASPSNPRQDFEHFYFNLQAAVAGLGVAIGPWHLVQNDIRNGLLVAPQGFREDGSAYFLLSAQKPKSGSASVAFGNWLRAVARDEGAS